MGAFCVYGVSRVICKATADKKVAVGRKTIAEWAVLRDQMAEKLFLEASKRVKISPEFDAPQFSRDWIAASPEQVRLTLIMARQEKIDSRGERVIKGGMPVMTWAEYKEPPSGLF